jgi:choline-glycine betaine transporter
VCAFFLLSLPFFLLLLAVVFKLCFILQEYKQQQQQRQQKERERDNKNVFIFAAILNFKY